jgi:hypothetical protein
MTIDDPIDRFLVSSMARSLAIRLALVAFAAVIALL